MNSMPDIDNAADTATANGHRLVLFLCTGNYYRSRFAASFFNYCCAREGLEWRAFSRGLNLKAQGGNIGPMSRVAQERLRLHGVTPATLRFPQQASREDFAAAERVIALQAGEHRPLLETRYPEWTDRVEYWDVPDVKFLATDQALERIEQSIHAMLATLK